MKLKGWNMRRWSLLLGSLLFLMPTLSIAQPFPTKPINLTIGIATGGTVDISSRLLASAAEKILGHPFIITNNGGAAGVVAIGILTKEKPDGYHLVSSPNTPLILVPQLRDVPYKLEDVVPIMHFAAPQSGLVVRADSPWKTFKEFVEYAKKNPGKVSYTLSGVYGFMHLAMLYVAKQEGIEWTAIPVSGSDPNMPVLGGHVTAHSGASSWVSHVQAGKFRLLATHGERRMKSFPDVPTFRELGYDFVNESVYLITVPKGTPPPIVKRLDDAFRKALDDKEFVNYMEKSEIEIIYRNSEDTKKFLQEAYDRFSKMIVEFKIPKEK